MVSSLWYRPQFLGQVWIGTAAWPAIYQYVKFDATKEEGPLFGKFQRTPPESELNDLQRNSSKRWDLGWVYTVIAGVLNLLVIYDALAGPMFRDPPRWLEEEQEDAPVPGSRDAPLPLPPPPPPPPALPLGPSPYEPPANPQQGGTP